MTVVWNCVSNSEYVASLRLHERKLLNRRSRGLRIRVATSGPPASYRVLGAAPLGERVARNEVRAQGETSPSLYLKSNRCKIFLYLFFELVAL